MIETTEHLEAEIFLADTYALIEIIGGNLNYKPYTHNLLFTTQFNVIELYYSLLNNHGKEVAEKYLQLYARFVIPVSYSAIRYGMEFKLLHKKEKLSYVDCTGYGMARELGIKFLTGDQKFEKKENVEFVK